MPLLVPVISLLEYITRKLNTFTAESVMLEPRYSLPSIGVKHLRVAARPREVIIPNTDHIYLHVYHSSVLLVPPNLHIFQPPDGVKDASGGLQDDRK